MKDNVLCLLKQISQLSSIKQNETEGKENTQTHTRIHTHTMKQNT